MKKIISFILATALLLSLINISVCAETEAIELTESALTRSSLSITFNQAIDAECFNKNALLKDNENNDVAFLVTPSNDKKTFTFEFNEKLDTKKVYTLSFPYLYNVAKNVFLTDLSYELKFSELLNENFESYNTTADLDTKYQLYYDGTTYKVSELPRFVFQSSGWMPTGETAFQLNTDAEGNKSLYLSGFGMYHAFGPKESLNSKYYILDFDMKTTVPGAFYLDIFTNPNKDTYGAYRFIGPTMDAYLSNFIGNGQFDLWVNRIGNEYPNSEKLSVSIHRLEGAQNDTMSVYINGGLYSTLSNGKLRSGDSVGFGFPEYADKNNQNTYTYVDNIVAYKPEVTKTSGNVSFAPTLSNAKVEGNFIVGESVNATYLTNADSSVTTVLEWYRNDDYFAEFPKDWERITDENGVPITSSSYTITNADKDNYIVCRVLQKIILGDEEIIFNDIKSAPVYELSAPIAINAEIIKNEGSLYAKFDYFDANGDNENGTEVKWEVSTDKITWVSGENVKADDMKTYLITEADYSKYLRCTITVKNDAVLGDQAVPVVLEYSMPFAPEVKNISLSGGNNVGDFLKAYYEYYDENGDKMTDVEIKWYKRSSSGQEFPLTANGLNYCVSYDDQGFEIGVRFIPKNDVVPKTGKTYETSRILINYVPAQPSYSGSSGSSGGSFSAVTPSSPKKPSTFVPEPVVVPQSVSTFNDTKGHWAEKDIEEMVKAGFIKGRSENIYDPEAAITRAEWLTLLLRGAGINADGEYKDAYSDVTASDWFAKEVQKAFDLKIIAADDSFRGNDEATREEMAIFAVAVYEYKKSTASEGSLEKFTDSAEISEAAKTAVAKAVGLGLMNGMSETEFAPKKNSTRAQAAVMLKRAVELIK